MPSSDRRDTMCNGPRVIRCGGCRSLGVFHATSFPGAIIYAHFGTPCNTFSSARKEDGGPPPLRDVHHPDGIPSLTGDLWFTTFLGNLFRDRTCEACFVLVLLGADFSIENPLSSLIWETPLMISLLCRARAFVRDFDQCAFGAPSKKPTRMMVTHQLLQKATST